MYENGRPPSEPGSMTDGGRCRARAGRVAGRGLPTFVAARAGHSFTRLHVGDGAHGLVRKSIFVQRLKQHRFHGRYDESCGTIRLDRHGPENRPSVFFTRQADARRVRNRCRLGEDLDDAQLLDRSAQVSPNPW